ncbi:MAG: phosphoribosylaminoimidazole carboxylase [Candidatus Omnitrophota bacterium]
MTKYKDSGNLFARIPDKFTEEIFNTLFETDNLKIERIVSNGHCTDKDQWLEQDRDEWVFLIQGAAKLLFKQQSQTVNMKPGDYVFIKAYAKHRVERTDLKQKTIWLAVHGHSKKK